MFQAIFFDMDGTLLPMDQDQFVKAYFGALCKRFAQKGYEPQQMIDVIWKGTGAMVKNDGSVTNCDRFWQYFASVYGEEKVADRAEFDDFYTKEFIAAKAVTAPTPLAAECIRTLKSKGYPLVLATNPIFPMVAQRQRMAWAGLSDEDFIHVTAYENSSFCKPNPAYYAAICEKLHLDPAGCLMIGNDWREDGAAAKLGMDLYLITDCLIAPEDADLGTVKHGTMAELLEYLKTLPDAQ